MRAVIMGSGRVGSRLAKLLYEQGYEVAIIDESSNSFRRLDPSIDVLTITGTAIDEDVLKQAGLEGADVFAAVTNRDNSNLMAAQIAKHHFNVPTVLVRIYDPARGEIFNQIGMQTISPTTIIADIFFNEVMKQAQQPSPNPSLMRSGVTEATAPTTTSTEEAC